MDILDNLKFIFKTMKNNIFLLIWGLLLFPLTIVAINLCDKFITVDLAQKAWIFKDIIQTWIFPCSIYPIIHELIGYIVAMFTTKGREERTETIDAFRKLCKLSLYVGWFLMMFLIAHEGIISSLLISILITNILFIIIALFVGLLSAIIGNVFFKNFFGGDISFTDFLMLDWLFHSK